MRYSKCCYESGIAAYKCALNNGYKLLYAQRLLQPCTCPPCDDVTILCRTCLNTELTNPLFDVFGKKIERGSTRFWICRGDYIMDIIHSFQS